MTSATITSGRINVRQNGSYLVGSSSNMSDITSTFTNICVLLDAAIFVRLDSSSSLGGTNNDAVSIYIEDLIITFA